MKDQKRKAMNQYKRDLRKVYKAFLYAIPFMFIVCLIFPFFDVDIPTWIIVALAIVVGGLFTLLFYVISEHRAKKKLEQKEKSGKIDPFAD